MTELHMTVDERSVLAEAGRRMLKAADHALSPEQWRSLAYFVWACHPDEEVSKALEPALRPRDAIKREAA